MPSDYKECLNAFHHADDAIKAGCKVAVCSTSNEKAVQTIVDVMLGTDVAKVMRVFAGDVVPAKKPDPAIYELAATRLGVEPSRCASCLRMLLRMTACDALHLSPCTQKFMHTKRWHAGVSACTRRGLPLAHVNVITCTFAQCD